MMGPLDFEDLVHRHYAALYRFALSLTRTESDACDLTQQTFYLWAAKGHQLRDPTKVKTWLFTTLHREFLETRRRHTRLPHYQLEAVSHELPQVDPETVTRLDALAVVELLARVDSVFQAAVALFYLEDYSYKEIAAILGVPIGTVKSRIARGLAQLQNLVLNASPPARARPRSTP
jgi:RNA polymerase sigma-70 factor (ECF subfamily)